MHGNNINIFDTRGVRVHTREGGHDLRNNNALLYSCMRSRGGGCVNFQCMGVAHSFYTSSAWVLIRGMAGIRIRVRVDAHEWPGPAS